MRIWSTPQHIFDALNAEFHFDMDVCANAENRKCECFIPRSLSLASDVSWGTVCWLNPPYGKEIGAYLEKAKEQSVCGSTVVALIPGRTNAPWWHDYVMEADEIRFVRKKLGFVADDGTKGVPSWGAVIAVFRPFYGGRVIPKVSSWFQPVANGDSKSEGT